jgi:uncharacterized protein YdhG (YjbR/CyaY superfamily)
MNFKKKLTTIVLFISICANTQPPSALHNQFVGGIALMVCINRGSGEHLANENQDLNRQQFERVYRTFWAECLLQALSVGHHDIRQEFNALQRIFDPEQRIGRGQSILRNLGNQCRNRSDARCAEINQAVRLFDEAMANMSTEWNNYRNRVAAIRREATEQVAKEKREAEERAQQERELVQRQQNQVFSDSVVAFANNWFGAIIQRGQWETTADFEVRRAAFFNDSTEFYFRRFAMMVTDSIVSAMSNVYIQLGDYDADTRTFPIGLHGSRRHSFQAATLSPNNRISIANVVGSIAVALSEARNLRGGQRSEMLEQLQSVTATLRLSRIQLPEAQRQHFVQQEKTLNELILFTLAVNPADVRIVIQNEAFETDRGVRFRRFLYPSAVYADSLQKYDIDAHQFIGEALQHNRRLQLDTTNNVDIVFRGRYLWTDNPRAANLELNYRDLVKERQEEIENWKRRITAENLQNLTIETSRGRVKIEVGKPLDLGEFRDTVSGRVNQLALSTRGWRDFSINRSQVFSFSTNRRGVVTEIRVVNADHRLGFEIFDTETKSIAQAIKPIQGTAVIPEPAPIVSAPMPAPEPQLRPTQEERPRQELQEQQSTTQTTQQRTTPQREPREPRERTPRESNTENVFLLSIRPEFIAQTAVMGIGLNIEFGAILGNGLFLSGDFGGGAIYWGGGFNIGYCFNKDGTAKNVLGATFGPRFAVKLVDFMVQPPFSIRESGINTSFGGIFHKLMLGGQNNFDLTNRLMFGHRDNPVLYISDRNRFVYEKGLNLSYSVSIGYTLTRRQK